MPENYICASCGGTNFGLLHRHHIWGRKNSKETVWLCPNCHSLVHGMRLIIDNEASRNALKYIDSLGRFVSPIEETKILKDFGYEPIFDGMKEELSKNKKLRDFIRRGFMPLGD